MLLKKIFAYVCSFSPRARARLARTMLYANLLPRLIFVFFSSQILSGDSGNNDNRHQNREAPPSDEQCFYHPFPTVEAWPEGKVPRALRPERES